MNFLAIINDRDFKHKEKTELLCRWILNHPEQLNEMLEYAQSAKAHAKASCIEAIDYATAENPDLASFDCLTFVTQNLSDISPRVKWESARVIGNIAYLYPSYLGEVIRKLIVNSKHEGTVVRWSAAYALGEILKLNTRHNATLIPAIEAISESEVKISIRRTYQRALKKAKK